MIKIDFQEPDTENWKTWMAQCEAEQQLHNEAIQRGDESTVKGRIYKGKDYNIKSEVYMNLHGPFHGKCAYCESYTWWIPPVSVVVWLACCCAILAPGWWR